MKKLMLFISVVLLLIMGTFYFTSSNTSTDNTSTKGISKRGYDDSKVEKDMKINGNKSESEGKKKGFKKNKNKKEAGNIDQLTSEKIVLDYLKENKELPDYYITKKRASESGWISKKGNLCEVLPNRAIGGDIFTNREKSLPDKKGRVWYEADLNYNCGRRNADRVLFSSDGLIFVTHDHYKNFEKIK